MIFRENASLKKAAFKVAVILEVDVQNEIINDK